MPSNSRALTYIIHCPAYYLYSLNICVMSKYNPQIIREIAILILWGLNAGTSLSLFNKFNFWMTLVNFLIYVCKNALKSLYIALYIKCFIYCCT